MDIRPFDEIPKQLSTEFCERQAIAFLKRAGERPAGPATEHLLSTAQVWATLAVSVATRSRP